jgi:Arc/MetJ family transcription regulator
MRTTVTIDDDLIELAAQLTGTTDRGVLVRSGLEALIRVESARRLAALGGSDPDAASGPRHRAA